MCAAHTYGLNVEGPALWCERVKATGPFQTFPLFFRWGSDQYEKWRVILLLLSKPINSA